MVKDALEVVGVLLKEFVVAVGVDLLDESVFLGHLHLHSDPFAWQAPCTHHVVAEAAGLEAGFELVVEDVVEAIFEVVAAKGVVVETADELAAVEFEAADEELDLETVVVGTVEEVAAAEAEHFLFHEIDPAKE